jgi:hypothetical protein
MNLLEHTSNWVKGEVTQGKIMVPIALILLFAVVTIWKSDQDFLRSMVIPLSLVVLAIGGYGGFQIFGRPGHVGKVQEVYDRSQQEALQMEYDKAVKDDKTYSRLKPIWAGLIIVCMILYFVFREESQQGFIIGLAVMFLSVLLLDTTLHHRLKIYLAELQNLMS